MFADVVPKSDDMASDLWRFEYLEHDVWWTGIKADYSNTHNIDMLPQYSLAASSCLISFLPPYASLEYVLRVCGERKDTQVSQPYGHPEFGHLPPVCSP